MAISDLVLEVETLFRQAEIECYSNANKAIELLEELHSKSNNINYEEGMCKALLLLGTANFVMGNYSISDEYYLKCIQLSHVKNIINIKIRAIKAKGDLYLKVRDYESALEYNFNCLDLLSEISYMSKLKESIYFNIGVIYKELEQYEYALDYFNEALNISTKEDEKLLFSSLYTNMALCYINLNNSEMAEEYIIDSINISKDYNSIEDLGYSYYAYATYYVSIKEYRKAEEYYINAMTIQQNNELSYSLVDTMAEYGCMLYNIRNYSMAEKIFSDANLILLKVDNIKAELKISLFLAKIYEETNQFEKALVYYKRYNNSQIKNDSIWKKLKVKNIINKYEIVQSDIKLKELKQANQNLRTLSDIGKKITASLKKEEILDVIRANIYNLVECHKFSIGLIEKDEITYEVHEKNKCNNIIIELNEKRSIVAYMVKSKKAVLVNNMEDMHFLTTDYYKKREMLDHINSIIFCPLIYKETVLGIISVQSYNKNSFNNNDVEILKILASYVSIAMNNYLQSERIISTNKQLKELTQKDPLTKVYNRYSLSEKASSIINRASKKGEPYSVVMVDVDFFKEFNDHYGHLEGDKCLVKVARLLEKAFSKHKTYIYRYGGDEFLIILLNKDIEEAYKIVDDMRKDVEKLDIGHTYSKCSNVVTLTVGIVTIRKPIKDFNSIFALADKALYIAKRSGRNRTKQLICR